MSVEEQYQILLTIPNDIYQHLPTLRRYAESCDRVVEFGTRSMVSTVALLAARPRVLIAVDTVHPDSVGGNLNNFYEMAAETETEFYFFQQSDLTFNMPGTDMLFIDTWHVYTQLKQELDMHHAKVRKFIVLHDTETFKIKGEAEGHEGLGKAIIEFQVAHPEWHLKQHFTNNNGLTILEKR